MPGDRRALVPHNLTRKDIGEAGRLLASSPRYGATSETKFRLAPSLVLDLASSLGDYAVQQGQRQPEFPGID
jgi:hypothetical protein